MHLSISMFARILVNAVLSVSSVAALVPQTAGALGQLDLAEIFRVGDGMNSEILFGFVSDMDVNSTGHVFVAEGMANSIFVFSDSGEFVDVIGSSGSGPGEFQDISGVYIGPADSVYVLDTDLYRLSVFEPRSHRFVYSANVPGVGMSDPAHLLGLVDGGFLIVYRSPMSHDLVEAYDRKAVINLVSRNGSVAEEPVISLPDWNYVSSRHHTLLIPFGPRFKFILGSDGLVYSGLNDIIDIRITTLGGHLRGTVQYDLPVVPVTKRDIDEYIEGMSREARRLILTSVLPENMPAYKAFTVDDRNRVWIQRLGDGGMPTGEWLILNKESDLVATITLPESENLFAIREGKVYGTGKDVSGATYVITYRIDE